MSDRPTPETDAAEWLAEDGSGGIHSVVSIHVARKLERQRDEALADAQSAKDIATEYGMKLDDALRQRDELLKLMQEFCARVERGEIRSTKTYRKFSSAIAKVKGNQ